MKQVVAVVLCVLLTACANQFPKLNEQIKDVTILNVIVDSAIHEDLKGTDIGFDQKRNGEIATIVKETVSNELKRRGYKANFLRSGSSMFFKPKTGYADRYVYSSNGKSTGKKYEGILQSDEGKWEKQENMTFYRKVFRRGPNVSSPNAKKKAPFINQDEIPEVLKSISPNLLVLVKVEGQEISQAKSALQGMAIGLTTALVTGAIVPVLPSVAAYIEIAIVNTKTGDIIWYNLRESTLIKYLADNISRNFTKLPAKDGEKLGPIITLSDSDIEWED